MKYYMIKFLEVTIALKSAMWYHSIIEHWMASITTTQHHWALQGIIDLSHCIIECHVASWNTTHHQWTQHQWTTQTINEQHMASLSTIEQHWTPLCITECLLVWQWCRWFYSLSDRHTSPCVDSEFYQSTAGPVLASVLAPAQLPVYTGKRNPYHKHTKKSHILLKRNFQYMYMYSIQVFIANKIMECSLLKSFMTLELTLIVALMRVK